ncbi:MAG: glycoside hydrolase family 88 protein [Balneolaceae bacterium]
MIISKKLVLLISVLGIGLISCSQTVEEKMTPKELAEHVSDVLISGTDFHFEPALQEFEQDGLFMVEFPAGQAGVFYARSVITVEDNEAYNFDQEFGISHSAGSIKMQLNGNTIYSKTTSEDGHFDYVDYGLFEYQDKFAVDLPDGEHQLAIKFIPESSNDNNRVYFNIVRSDNALSHPAVGARSPSADEELADAGYWWIGPLPEGADENSFMNPNLSPSELVAGEFLSVNSKPVRWDIPKRHLVKRFPGWLRYQNWHYSTGTFLDAMKQTGETFPELDYKDYINEHLDYFLNNKDHIAQMREEYGLIESPFGHYFRFSLLDDMGMQTVPYVSRLIENSDGEVDQDSEEFKLAESVVDHIMNNASRLPDGTFARYTPDSMSVWADDLYMSSIVLLKMSELTGDNKYLDEVVKQVILFDEHLTDEASNLYWHGWFSRNEEHSSSKWARANGWTMMAKTELLLVMPDGHPQKEKILEIFGRHAEGLLDVQSSDGRWHQVLDDPSTYLETSATAMFVRAYAVGITEGWLENEGYSEAAEQGWKALTNQVNEEGDIVGIVRGTPIMFSDEEYANWDTRENDPRGLGAVIYAAIAMEKFNDLKN